MHLRPEVRGGAKAAAKSSGGVDVALLIYFALWYLGNYYVSCFNVCRGTVARVRHARSQKLFAITTLLYDDILYYFL